MRDKLIGKRKAIAPLKLKLIQKELKLLSDPEFIPAMRDRQKHIDGGDLWITPQSIRFAPLIMEIATLESMIDSIRATPARLFRHSGRLDKRKIKHKNKNSVILSANIGEPVPVEIKIYD